MSANWNQTLASAKSAITSEKGREAFCILSTLITPDNDFVVQARIAKVFSSIPTEQLGLKPIRIALLASTTVDHFSDILRFWLARDGFAAEIWIAPYDTIIQTTLDETSELYSFRPDIIWIFSTYRDVRICVPIGDDNAVMPAIDLAIATNTMLWQTIQSRLPCAIIQNNADIPYCDSFGN